MRCRLATLPRMLVVVEYLHHQRQRRVGESTQGLTDTVTDLLIEREDILSVVLGLDKCITVRTLPVAPREAARRRIALVSGLVDLV